MSEGHEGQNDVREQERMKNLLLRREAPKMDDTLIGGDLRWSCRLRAVMNP
jgi:hypothetical protein